MDPPPIVSSSTAAAAGGTKKTLQEMSKEELIQRCRNLLALAQKAKLARDGEQTLFGLFFQFIKWYTTYNKINFCDSNEKCSYFFLAFKLHIFFVISEIVKTLIT